MIKQIGHPAKWLSDLVYHSKYDYSLNWTPLSLINIMKSAFE